MGAVAALWAATVSNLFSDEAGRNFGPDIRGRRTLGLEIEPVSMSPVRRGWNSRMKGMRADSRSRPRPKLLVTIHDVAPPFASGVRQLLDELDQRNIRPRVLKVVPCYAGRWPLAEDAELCRLLRAEVAAGSEIVAHGWSHTTRGRLQGSPLARLRGRLFAPRASEFSSLSAPIAGEAALAARRAIVEAIGVEPDGFCAPAWLTNHAGRSGVASAGYRYVLEQSGLRDLRTGRAIATPWQGFMGVGGFHERLLQLGNWAVAALARLRYGGLSRSPVVKVFLHPQRLQDGRARRRVLDHLTALAAQRDIVTASQLLALGNGRSQGNQKSPLISVIVPALNEQSHITFALKSVAEQQYPLDRVECVVVDNGSRDTTVDVVENLARRWTDTPADMPPVRLAQEPNRGTARAKNLGATLARGDVLVFLDADSTLEPAVLLAVASAWRNGSHGGSIRVKSASNNFWECGFFNALEFGKRLFDIHSQMVYLDWELFQRLGGFDCELQLAEDLDLMRRATASLRSSNGRLQRIGPSQFLGQNRGAASIRTSPRRLRALPWRIGMIWMFLRWALGFLGIGRRWYSAGGPAPGAPSPPATRVAGQMAHAGLRIALKSAGKHAPGRPSGLLWIWWVWDRLYSRWHRLQPVRSDGLLLYGLEIHKDWRPLILPDGNRIRRGDLICRIHFSNRQLARLAGAAAPVRTWQVIKTLREDLAALSQQMADGSLDRNGRCVQAVTATTLLFRGARRLGFSIREQPPTWRRELDRAYMLGLLSLYMPERTAHLRRNRDHADTGQADMAPLHQGGFAFQVGEMWIDRSALLSRYAPGRNVRSGTNRD